MDRELIDGYLAGRLDEASRAEVEARIVGEPAFRREFELTEQLRAGLRELDAQGRLDTATVARPRAAFWQRPVYALAASVVAGLLGLTALALYGQLQRGREELAQLQQTLGRLQPGAVSGTRVVNVARTRAAGGEPDRVLQRIAPHELVQLRLDVGEQPAEARFAVTLNRVSEGTTVVLVSLPSVAAVPIDLEVAEPRMAEVVVSVHPALLTPGDYVVILAPVAGGTEALRYRVRVTP